jgi:hypothetical protein
MYKLIASSVAHVKEKRHFFQEPSLLIKRAKTKETMMDTIHPGDTYTDEGPAYVPL